jgi:hypothetical protein
MKSQTALTTVIAALFLVIVGVNSGFAKSRGGGRALMASTRVKISEITLVLMGKQVPCQGTTIQGTTLNRCRIGCSL